MGQSPAKLWDRFFKPPFKILIVGLDGAGKTSLLFGLRLGEIVTTCPIADFHVETVEWGSLLFTNWDLNDQEKTRHVWRHFLPGTQGVIFVVDSSDRDRIGQAKEGLHHLLGEEDLRYASLLVVANKQDVPGAMDAAEVSTQLELSSLQERHWFVRSACVTTGDGIFEGMDLLQRSFSNKKLWDGFGRRPVRLLLLGLDAAGKSSMLEQLRVRALARTVLTPGFDLEVMSYRTASTDLCLTSWDVGGQDALRQFLQPYRKRCTGVIFVVDSGDGDRISEARRELHKLLGEEELRGIPLLVFANKQDLPHAMSAAQVSVKLALSSLRGRNYMLQTTSGVRNDGLSEGLSWLAKMGTL